MENTTRGCHTAKRTNQLKVGEKKRKEKQRQSYGRHNTKYTKYTIHIFNNYVQDEFIFNFQDVLFLKPTTKYN